MNYNLITNLAVDVVSDDEEDEIYLNLYTRGEEQFCTADDVEEIIQEYFNTH